MFGGSCAATKQALDWLANFAGLCIIVARVHEGEKI